MNSPLSTKSAKPKLKWKECLEDVLCTSICLQIVLFPAALCSLNIQPCNHWLATIAREQKKMTTTTKSPPSSRASSASIDEEDVDISHKRELPGDVHEDPRALVCIKSLCALLLNIPSTTAKLTDSQNVADNVKNEFPDTGEPQQGKHHRPQRAPTARKGSEGGSSAAKRIHQTRLREKAQGKGQPEK